VFGIDIQSLSESRKNRNLDIDLLNLRRQASDWAGLHIRRALRDLVSAIHETNDTGFYCYRALETLRLHCASLHGLESSEKSKQWLRFREAADVDEATLRQIKAAADGLRHGEVQTQVSGEDRDQLLKTTWSIVDRYLSACSEKRALGA
jgi:hypothetical protein